MSFKEIKDERLELQKYRAGYKAFKVLIIVSVFIAFAIFSVFDLDNAHPILYLIFLPFFVGMGIFSYYAREYEEIDEEQSALKIASEKRTWKIVARRTIIMTLWMGLVHYFVMSRDTEKNIQRSLVFGIFNGIAMGFLEFYQLRSALKKAKEKENV